jgi:elongation factor 1-gamma
VLNLVSGWIQRLDQLRKWGFGSIIIFGKEGNIQIGSAWLFRGLEIPEEMKESDDYPNYEWRRADPLNNPKDKELLENYFAWDGDFGPNRTFCEGKIFK